MMKEKIIDNHFVVRERDGPVALVLIILKASCDDIVEKLKIQKGGQIRTR